MIKKLKNLTVPILLVLVLTLAAYGAKMAQLTLKFGNRPITMCMAPYNWAACGDSSFKGLQLNWGAKKDDNFIAALNVEDWNMIWNGSAYDRHVRKTYMISSSLLGYSQYGDCGGWDAICYKYSEFTDTVKP